jgi:hypothetical protein
MNEKHRWIYASVLSWAILWFVGLFAVAADAYPGGTHFDHARVGHDFWRNTLCDVARTVALDGQPNPVGYALARAAMTTLALGLGVLFVALPSLFDATPGGARLIRVLGVTTVPCAIAVVLLPTDRFSALHALAIVLAGTLGLATAVLVMAGMLADPRAPRPVVVAGALALGIASADFVLYVGELTSGGPAQVSVAVLERLATVAVLAWMAAAAGALRGRARRGRAHARDVCNPLHAPRSTRVGTDPTVEP